MWSNIKPGKTEGMTLDSGPYGRCHLAHVPSHFKGRASAYPEDLGGEPSRFAPLRIQSGSSFPAWMQRDHRKNRTTPNVTPCLGPPSESPAVAVALRAHR